MCLLFGTSVANIVPDVYWPDDVYVPDDVLFDIYSFQMGSEVLLDVKKNAHYYNVQFIDAFVILSLSNWDLMQLNIF